MARPKTDPVQAEREALIRIAELAASIANTLRQPGRGRYSSERTLRQWLSEDEVQFTVADIAPALTLLEVTQRLTRPEVERGNPRPGWLPEHAPEAVEDAPQPVEPVPAPPEKTYRNCPCCGRWTALDPQGRIGEHFYENGSCPGSGERTDVTSTVEAAEAAANRALMPEHLSLIKVIVRALTPGNGRVNVCESEDELAQRLASDGVECEPEQLSTALELLENNGDGNYDTGALPGLPYKIIRADPPQPTAFDPHPPRPLVLQQLRPY